MLLGIVPKLQPVPGHDLAQIRGFKAGKNAQKCGFTRAVLTEDNDFRPAVNRQVNVGENL